MERGRVPFGDHGLGMDPPSCTGESWDVDSTEVLTGVADAGRQNGCL
ncbi:hypothetical protein POX_b02687 [Penicillium oxalicum]|nr:hypothetical protein POX_b02687 [Penicillium oxalicum]KAI2792647.1 hypothetical protein POX_b02687 [Penicillium oxalicum]